MNWTGRRVGEREGDAPDRKALDLNLVTRAMLVMGMVMGMVMVLGMVTAIPAVVMVVAVMTWSALECLHLLRRGQKQASRAEHPPGAARHERATRDRG